MRLFLSAPAAVFFVAMFSLTAVIRAAVQGRGDFWMSRPLGVATTACLLGAILAYAARWFFVARPAAPHTKLLAAVVVALPLAATLAALQTPAPDAVAAGGVLGAMLVTAFSFMPHVAVTVVFGGLTVLGLYLAGRIVRGGTVAPTDPMSVLARPRGPAASAPAAIGEGEVGELPRSGELFPAHVELAVAPEPFGEMATIVEDEVPPPPRRLPILRDIEAADDDESIESEASPAHILAGLVTLPDDIEEVAAPEPLSAAAAPRRHHDDDDSGATAASAGPDGGGSDSPGVGDGDRGPVTFFPFRDDEDQVSGHRATLADGASAAAAPEAFGAGVPTADDAAPAATPANTAHEPSAWRPGRTGEFLFDEAEGSIAHVDDHDDDDVTISNDLGTATIEFDVAAEDATVSEMIDEEVSEPEAFVVARLSAEDLHEDEPAVEFIAATPADDRSPDGDTLATATEVPPTLEDARPPIGTLPPRLDAQAAASVASVVGIDALEPVDVEASAQEAPTEVVGPMSAEAAEAAEAAAPATPPAATSPRRRRRRERTEEDAPLFRAAAESEGRATGARARDDWAAWEGPPEPAVRASRVPTPERAEPMSASASAAIRAGRSAPQNRPLFEHADDPEPNLLKKATDLVISEQRCSVSLLQRHLRVTFGEATALIDKLQRNGVVGPHTPTGRRDVLIGAPAATSDA